MRKITGVFMLVFSMALLLSAMNQSFINKLSFEKFFGNLYPEMVKEDALYKAAFVNSDRWHYGDLYGLGYLHDYKLVPEPYKNYSHKPGRKNTGRLLYIIGDSFLAYKTLSGAFEAFDSVIFLDRRFTFGPIKLDTVKQNYLIMEFAERNLNGYAINKTKEIRWQTNEIEKGLNFSSGQGATGGQLPELLPDRLSKIIFNKDLSRNLELILFDNKLATPFKETKALLNYKLFNRTANEVTVSTDKKRLLINVAVDTASFQSSFKPKSDLIIDSIVHNLDLARDYYHAIGFKKVFLSVIPNAVSIYDDKRMSYNHLQERVEQKTHLPVVPLYKNHVI
jgi:hypothetical protein